MNLKLNTILSLLLIGTLQLSLAGNGSSETALDSREALERQLDEERLAYQLYTALGEIHPELRQFQNIPRAEARHFEMLRSYAEKQFPEMRAYALEGEIVAPATKALFDKLLAQGQASPAASLQAGIAVEKIDISDLDAALAVTEDPQLRAIYSRLRAGSEKHLAAFSGERGGKGKGMKAKGGGKSCGQQRGSCGCNCPAS